MSTVYRISVRPLPPRWWWPWQRWRATPQLVEDGYEVLMGQPSFTAASEHQARADAERWCQNHHARHNPRGAYAYDYTPGKPPPPPAPPG